MSDISIVSLLASTQIQGAASSANNRNATGVPTSALLGLVAGSFVTGTVVSRDSKDTSVLRTANGDITLKSDLLLKPGSEVVLRVEGKGDNVTARIVTIDGKVPNTATAVLPEDSVELASLPATPKNPAALNSANSQSLSPNAQTPATTVLPIQNEVTPKQFWLKATLVSPEMEAALQPGKEFLPAAIKQGASYQIRILRVDPPPANLSSPTQSAATAPRSVANETASLPSNAVSTPNQAALKLYGAYAQNTLQESALKSPNAVASNLSNNPAATREVTLPPITEPVKTSGDLSLSPTTNKSVQPLPVPPRASPTPLPNALDDLPTSTGEKTATILATEGAITRADSPLPVGSILTANKSAPADTAARTQNFMPLAEMEKLAETDTRASRPGEGNMQAVVIKNERSGESLLQSPMGMLRIKLPTPLPPGSTLLVDAKPVAPTPSPTQTVAAPIAEIADLDPTSVASGWPALGKSLEALAQYNPLILADAMQHLPETGPKFASAIMFFVTALRGGDTRSLLGPKALALLEEKGRIDLIGKLTGDMGNLRAMTEAPPNQWQSFAIPFLHQQELHQMHWHTRREAAQGSAIESGDTRFVVEVETSHLGPIQFDGLVRKKDAALAFDMIVRTNTPLPETMHRDIQDIYANASELTGFKGSLGFQVIREFPIQPARERRAANDSGIFFA